jgi:transcriptional regulator with XRE-family HTH domain
MKNYQSIVQIAKERKAVLGISLEQIAAHTGLGYRTVTRFFAGSDVKVSTLAKITALLGLDLNGESLMDPQVLRKRRAEKKARHLVSLVQETSALEMQGLSDPSLELLMEETERALLHGAYRRQLWAV